MSSQNDVHLLTLAGLGHRCAQESDLFFRRQEHDPRFCFELFRRAIVQHDERAWELIYTQYRPLVKGWVERHALFTAVDEEAQYFVNWAFEKMWSVMTPAKFAAFPDLKSILRYLQMCVHSALVDYARTGEHDRLRLEAQSEGMTGRQDGDATLRAAGEESAGHQRHASPGSPIEDKVMARLERQEFWREINERIKDEREQRVLYGSFVLALKPGEIYNLFTGTFSNVTEVYRVKENLIARLRRDETLKDLLANA